ncbi:MAG: metallophosphatase, partial [Tannerella sp.]|nr:metallophosphatase [Tannerella sp.]
MRVFLASLFAQLLLNPYVFWRSWKAIPPRLVWRIPLAGIFFAELLLFFFGYFFHDSLSDGPMQFILYVCGTWYIGLLYLTLCLICLEALRLSDRLFHWFPRFVRVHWSGLKLGLFFIVPLFVAGLLVRGNWVVRHPVVRHLYLNLPKGEGNRRDSLKIVLMSDLHIGEMIGKKMVEHEVALSNAQHPDLVVLVGDLLDLDLHVAERDNIAADLRAFRAPLGVYAVNGNHE